MKVHAEAQADMVAEQRSRIQALTEQKTALATELAEARSRSPEPPTADLVAVSDALQRRDAVIGRLEDQLRRAEAHATAECGRRTEAERLIRGLAEDVTQGTEREAILRSERDSLEAALTSASDDGSEAQAQLDLDGVTLLYVGGRPRRLAQARLFVEKRGGHLLTHDGGVDENPLLLPGLVGRAKAVLFPVDCVSHDAVWTLKRACRDNNVPFTPLRSASLAAFVNGLASLAYASG